MTPIRTVAAFVFAALVLLLQACVPYTDPAYGTPVGQPTGPYSVPPPVYGGGMGD